MNKRVRILVAGLATVLTVTVAGVTVNANAAEQSDGGTYQLTIKNDALYYGTYEARYTDADGNPHGAGTGLMKRGEERSFTFPIGSAEATSFKYHFGWADVSGKWHEFDRHDNNEIIVHGVPTRPEAGQSFCLMMVGVAELPSIDDC